jgi:hypothetical protein
MVMKKSMRCSIRKHSYFANCKSNYIDDQKLTWFPENLMRRLLGQLSIDDYTGYADLAQSKKFFRLESRQLGIWSLV